MKLIYITNTRLPSEKANSIQSIEMCKSFSNFFETVELWTSNVKNKPLDYKKISNFYNIRNPYLIKQIKNFDSTILCGINQTLWAQIKNITFAINTCFKLLELRHEKSIIIFSRVWLVNYLYFFLKKLNLIKHKIFFELHQSSRFQIYMTRNSDGIVVINKYLFNIVKNSNIKNILIAHDGVNPSTFAESNEYLHTKKTFYEVLYTGSFSEHKGVKLLVDTIAKTPNNIHFKLIGGKGRQLEDLRYYMRNFSYSNRIKIIEHVSQDKLIEHINSADILVLPNLDVEQNLSTSPLKLFEYMYSKKPILAANIPSIREIVTENDVFFFDAGNHQDLARNLSLIIEKDCADLVKNSYEKVLEYTWDKRAKKIDSFIKENIENDL